MFQQFQYISFSCYCYLLAKQIKINVQYLFSELKKIRCSYIYARINLKKCNNYINIKVLHDHNTNRIMLKCKENKKKIVSVYIC